MTDYTRLTISEAAERIRHRELSPTALLEAHLDRIGRLQPALNAFITLTVEQARTQAEAAEIAVARGEYLGALHGIPIALKDLYKTAGIRTTLGSRFFADYVPSEDAFVVQKLRQAGAVIVGKTNLHEIALGVTNDNPHYGTCRNPWDTSRSPGGSSGGSGAALAAGLCMGALGSDTRGSIRIPASLCGVVGLKPSYGRISVRGVMPLAWPLDHVGPMARSVRDTALLLNALSGNDPEDPFMVETRMEDFTAELGQPISGWRVAAAGDEFLGDDVAIDILAAYDNAIQALRQLGVHVETVGLGFLTEARSASQAITQTEAAVFHSERFAEHPEHFGSDVRRRLEMGRANSAADYACARRAQVILFHQLRELFRQYDLILTPTTPITAPHFDDVEEMDRARASLSRYTSPFNLTGVPALSLHCDFSTAGLPIGVQLIAPMWQETRLLRAAYALEQVFALSDRLVVDNVG